LLKFSGHDHWFDKFAAENAALIRRAVVACRAVPGNSSLFQQTTSPGVSDANRHGTAFSI
jgi:hypothetical protein